jgi:hypothetical protein
MVMFNNIFIEYSRELTYFPQIEVYRVSSLKQLFVGLHVAPLGNMDPIPSQQGFVISP